MCSYSTPPMPCTTPPAICPSTTMGLIMTPQSSLTTYRKMLTWPVTGSTSTVAAWQALENVNGGALNRSLTSSVTGAPSGSVACSK